MDQQPYGFDVPPLPPLASGLLDCPAAGIRANDRKRYSHLNAAENQLLYRKIIWLFQPNMITMDELGGAALRHHILKSALFDLEPNGAHLPVWAQIILGRVQRGEIFMEDMQRIQVLCLLQSELRFQRLEDLIANVRNDIANDIANVRNDIANVQNDITELRISFEDNIVPELGLVTAQLATQKDLLTRLLPPIPDETRRLLTRMEEQNAMARDLHANTEQRIQQRPRNNGPANDEVAEN